MQQPLPQRLGGRYVIQKKIGEGGMGIVYAGVDAVEKRPIAVKSMQAAATEAQIERFRREGDALARLNHPNIVKIIDMVQHEGQYFIVMEHVPGGDLRQRLKGEGALSYKAALGIALELADALSRAHHLNIIHRDIKPANVLLAEDGTPRLSDFGVALFEDQSSLNTITGTYAYLSPESLMGLPIDERSDIWAFGIMLFEMLTGKRPFDAPDLSSLLVSILNDPLPDVRLLRGDLPDDLVTLLGQMLSKEADARIPSVRLIGAALEAIRKGTAVPSLYAPPLPVPPAAAKADETAEKRPSPFQAPPLPDHFVGREAVLSEAIEALRGESRFVGLVGMGGSGKSTVAVALAHRLREQFADGVLWVDATLTEPMEVMAAWGQAFGFDFSGLNDLASRTSAVQALLAEREILIVLDDVAQLSRIRPLLPNDAERCAVLLTTRDQEIVYGLDQEPLLLSELAEADSLELLRQILGSSRVNKELAAAKQICGLLHHLPLAVEIVAQRLKSHRRRRLRDMARRLEDTQQRLEIGVSDPAVRTSFTLSWQTLDMQQQRLFSLLAVFAGRPFTPEAMAHVADLDLYTTEDLLFALTSLSLVKEDGERGYRQHPLLADFALEKLAEPDVAFTQMTGYYYTFAQEYGSVYEVLRPEWDNIAAAIGVAHQQKLWSRVLAFADVLTPAWKARGRFTQARSAYRLADEAAVSLESDEQRAANLLRWGEAALEQNDYDEAKQHLAVSLAIYEQLREQDGIARSQIHLARIATEQGENDEAGQLLDSCQAIWEEIGDKTAVAWVLYRKGMTQYNLRQFAAAKMLLEQSIAIQEVEENELGMIPALRLLAQIPLELQSAEDVKQHAEKAYALSHALQDQGEIATTLFTLTIVYRRLGDIDTAENYAQQGIALLKRMGLQRIEAFLLFEISIIHELRHEYEKAVETAQQSMKILQTVRDKTSFNWVRKHLGNMYYQLGQLAEAKTEWHEVAKFASATQHATLLKEVEDKLARS